MVFKITKRTTKAQFDAWLASLPPSKVEHAKSKPFDAKQYFGKLKRNLDGLKLQKLFRDEWR